MLGQIAGIQADNQWHRARFDLLSALKNAGLPSTVQSIAFAAPDRDYLRSGIGGNHLGAAYEVANFNADKSGSAPTQVAAR